MWANNPQKGIKAHWDFTRKHNIDLIKGAELKYDADKNSEGEYIFVRNLKNGKTSLRGELEIPYELTELDSFTIVLKYYLEPKERFEHDSINNVINIDFDKDIIDGEFLFIHSRCAVESDDDIIEFYGYANDSTRYFSTTRMDIVPDENNEFTIVATYKELHPNDTNYAGNKNYLFGCGINGKMKYYYTNFVKKKNVINLFASAPSHDEKIMIKTNPNSDASLTEIILYDRILSPEEIAQAMGTDSVDISAPEDDHTGWKDWRLLLFAVLAAIIIYKLHKSQKIYPKKYSPISKAYIIKNYGEADHSPEKRQEALLCIADIWEEFGDRKRPVHPKDPRKVRALFEKALATRCTDKEIIDEYNSLAALINEEAKYDINIAGFFGAIAVFLIASLGPLFSHQWLYEIQQQSFFINWVAMALCVLAAVYIKRATPGERIGYAFFRMRSMRIFGKLAGSLLIGAGVSLGSVLMVILGAIYFVLYVTVTSIHTVVWVSVSTGRVVGSTITGGFAGLLLSFLALYGISLLLDFIWPLIEWVLIVAAPCIVYAITLNASTKK